VIADRGYDSNKHRRELRRRGIKPVIARRDTEHGSGLGTYRWVIERSLSWLHRRDPAVRRAVGSDASQRIIDALNMLRDEPVPARGWTLGADVPPAGSDDSGGRWEFGLVSDYDSWEQLQAYYSTDEHAALVDKIVPLIADRAVCDFEV
jgi:transposase